MQTINEFSYGIYVLEISLSKEIKILHEKFSEVKFKKGYYYYIGSAQKNLPSRVSRHCSNEKKIKWHIDYLTTANEANIIGVFIIPKVGKLEECNLSITFSKNLYSVEIKNFGNSDCTKCNTHLYYFKTKPDYSQLFSLYQETVLFIPSSRDIFCSQPKSFNAF